MADTWVDLYLCPERTIATLRVIISNRSSAPSSFKVAASKDGDAIENKHEVASDTPIAANEPGSTIGFVISSGDIVRVRSANGLISFTATGETRTE